MYTVLDTNHDTTLIAPALKGLGYRSIGRYIASGLTREEKVIKPPEARAIAAAGLRLFLVYEIGGKPSGEEVGNRDGTFAAEYAPTVGADEGAVIYYTVDYDAPRGDFPAIQAAFTAFRSWVFPKFRVGAYASGYVCNQLYEQGIIEKRWLTMSRGFDGTKVAIASGAYDILQILPQPIAGVDADPDMLHIANGDIGDFLPFGAALNPATDV